MLELLVAFSIGIWGPLPCGQPVVDTSASLTTMALATPAFCHIAIDREVWRQSTTDERCSILLHEIGHLRLQSVSHSPNPRSIMHAEFHTDPRCVRLARFLAVLRRGRAAARAPQRHGTHTAQPRPAS